MTVSTQLARADHLALEARAAGALAGHDFAAAFRWADRRCRMSPPPEAHAYVLRAEASFRMGEHHGAIVDLGHALEIAPHDIRANRRMLHWGPARHRRRAALALIAEDSDVRVLRDALAAAGDRRPHGAVRADEDRIRGWAVWRKGESIEVVVASAAGETARSTVHAAPSHPLHGTGFQAASFDLPRPHSDAPHFIHLAVDGLTFATTYAPPNDRSDAPPLSASIADGVTVIVPVYRDYDATRTCLDALLAELRAAPRHRAIVVNDATPEPRIARYLDRIAGHPGLRIIANAANRGFVGSVNRALLEVDGGDIILLNADTIPPGGFIDRLAQAAANDPRIGTVVPLSNSSELTSFPVRGGCPARSPTAVAALDAVAARVNAGRVVDIPAGTGFCLYVTRACLAAVGPLSDAFHFGYFEDIDFGLRAREHGFRAVCAPSVYVGHLGSRSFGPDKSPLVARNFPLLAERFPDYARECAAFDAADPLGSARAAIEHELPPEASGARLLVSGAGLADICGERARQLSDGGSSVLVLHIGSGPHADAHLSAWGQAAPQSLRFRLDQDSDRGMLRETLLRLAPAAIEIIDPAGIPLILLDILLERRLPLDMLIADDGLLRTAECGRQRQSRWADARQSVRHFLAPNRRAEAWASHHLDPAEMPRIINLSPRPAPRRRPRIRPAPRLAAVPSRSSPGEARIIRELAVALAARIPDAAITVFGDFAVDPALSRFDNVFMTGTVAARELPRLLRQYDIGYVLAGFGRPLFGRPLTERALISDRPLATVDWSHQRTSRDARDLALHPGVAPRAMAAAIAEWMEGTLP